MAALDSPVPSERSIRFAYRADKVLTDPNIACETAPLFSYEGQQWSAVALHELTKNTLDVFITPIGGVKQDTTLIYIVRLVRDDVVLITRPPTTVNYKPTDQRYPGCRSVVQWPQLLSLFSEDGEFTVELAFATRAKERRLGSLPTGALKDVVFTDFTIAYGSDFVIPCHKFVVARESKVIMMALLNPSSKESRTSTFPIGHDSATEEITRLFVQSMYEGWIAEFMDPYAEDLFDLGDCYECDRLVVMATESLKRQLTDDTFWSTTTLAVQLVESQPALLDICVNYADAFVGRSYKLLNSSEHDDVDDSTISALVKAVAKLHT